MRREPSMEAARKVDSSVGGEEEGSGLGLGGAGGRESAWGLVVVVVERPLARFEGAGGGVVGGGGSGCEGSVWVVPLGRGWVPKRSASSMGTSLSSPFWASSFSCCCIPFAMARAKSSSSSSSAAVP